MTAKFMLDTDSVSFALRGQGKVAQRILEHRPSELCVSAITVAELRFGADKRSSRKLHRLIDTFTRTIQVAPFSEEAASLFGKLANKLASQGVPIGDFDTLIAAHAKALGLTFVTNNVKHFNRVAGLRVENWV